MTKKRKPPKPETKLPVDPNAPTFQAGDEIVVQRRPLWDRGKRGWGNVPVSVVTANVEIELQIHCRHSRR